LVPASQKCSFQQFTLREGFETNHNGIRALRVGIDGGIWLSESESRAGISGELNPELASLFYRLCELLRFSVTAIFVFKGTNGPDFKWGQTVSKSSHPLTRQFQSLIKAFGFHCHQAPGDAEAELAYLNRLNLVDLIFTVDASVFIFGATHVVYSPEEDDFQDAYIYTSEAIKRRVNLSLGGLLLIVILTGGDYDETGLVGCEEDVAYSQGQRGLGDSLLSAMQTLGPAELAAFLVVWRNALREDLTGQGHLDAAAQISEAFPNPDILDLYVHPVTSGSYNGAILDVSGWVVLMPDIISISRLCEELFSWGTAAELPEKFSVLLPGLCLKRL
ncbi:PIN domain-like protein, partial [Mycena galericulata]